MKLPNLPRPDFSKWKLPKFGVPSAPKWPFLAKLLGLLDPAVGALNKRTAQEKQIILGLLIALVVAADFILIIRPVAGALFEQAPKLPPLRQELKQLRQDMKDKDGIARRWDEAQVQVKEQEKQFVDTDGAPALLEGLSQRAQRAGVKIMSLEPKETNGGESLYAPLPIEIKASAGMHELGHFISDLETGTSFFRVNNLRVSANAQNERKHLVQLSLETYKTQK